MELANNQVLITGGATGIGLCLAEEFLKAGSQVALCGRRPHKLHEAQVHLREQGFAKMPVVEADVASPVECRALCERVLQELPQLNVLVNNAGMQRQIDLKEGTAALEQGDDEIAINLRGPIALCALFMPHLLQQPRAAIINVTSGLAFRPMAIMPIYCATKAALHSYTLSLRQQLQGSTVQVFELIPPMVNTELDRGARARRAQMERGLAPAEVAAAAMQALREDRLEIAVGMAARLMEPVEPAP